MSSRPAVLGELLERVKRPVPIEPGEQYATLGVRWYGAGCFLKESVDGSKIAAGKLFQIEGDDVVFSRLFAWKGSFGVVGPAEAGAVASNEFPTFRTRFPLLPGFFALWSARPESGKPPRSKALAPPQIVAID